MKAVALLALLAAPAWAAPAEYQLTPTHSFVHFEWSHAGLSTLHGRFDKAAGRVTMDREARTGHGAIELRLDSVNTGRPALDAALRRALGADRGDALSRFELDALRFDGARPVAAVGRWRWRDTVLPLELRAERFDCYLNPLLRREVCGGDFAADVDAAAAGVRLDAGFGLGPTVRLRVQVEAVRLEPDS
jgi:polyisoprenoid-binding protein YceI